MVNQKSLKFLLIPIAIVFFLFNFIAIFNKFQYLTTNSYQSLVSALQSINSAETEARSLNLEQASQNFQQANQFLKQIQDNTWVFDNQILSTTEITQAGQLITQVGGKLSQVSSNLKQLPQTFFEANKQAFLTPDQSQTIDLTSDLFQTKNTVEISISQLDQAYKLLEKQSYTLLPKEVETQYTESMQKLQQVQTILNRLDTLLASGLDMMGHQTSHRYLVLLQNQNELRPLGGFLGSVLSFELDRGLITDLKFQDIYDIDGQSSMTLDTPPEFKNFTGQIFSRDANYTPDPKASIARINQLFQSSKQPNYRSFIILNHNFLSKLLSKTGPATIQLENQSYYLTADNFALILNTIVELDQNKDIVGPTIQQLQSHIFENISISDLSDVIYQSLQDRDLQFFTYNNDLQNEFENLPTLNPIQVSPNQSQDYLLITETNVGGNKSDQYIQRQITHQTSFQDSLRPTNTISITKIHTYSNNQEIINNSILNQNGIPRISEELRYILGRGDNKNQTKIYIPKDSKLVSFQGEFTQTPEILFDPEMNKDYILFESIISPGQTQTLEISYQPNIKITKDRVTSYQLLHQKPSGYSYQFQKSFISPQNKYAFNSPSFPTDTNNPFQVSSQLQTLQKDQILDIYLYAP